MTVCCGGPMVGGDALVVGRARRRTKGLAGGVELEGGGVKYGPHWIGEVFGERQFLVYTGGI